MVSGERAAVVAAAEQGSWLLDRAQKQGLVAGLGRRPAAAVAPADAAPSVVPLPLLGSAQAVVAHGRCLPAGD
jgi:hypothetical protein